jgi:diaminopimelate decarboxylase
VACDSGDVFAWGRDRTGPRMLPRTERGDVLMVLDVGAYQQALASNYNMLPTAPAFDIGEPGTTKP